MLLRLSKFFLIAAVFTPIFVSRNLFFPFISAKAIIFRSVVELALLLFLLHVFFLKDRKNEITFLKRRLKHPLTISVIIFATVFALSALTAVNPTQAFWSNFERGEGAFQIIHYALFFLLLILTIRDRKEVEIFLKSNILACALASFYAIGQYFSLQGKLGLIGDAADGRVSGTLGNPSYLAAYALINLGFIAYFLRKATRSFIGFARSWRIAFWGALLIFDAYIVFRTGTRGAMLALGAGILTVLILSVIQSKNFNLRLSFFVLLLAGVATVAVFFATPQAPIWRQIPGFSRFLNLENLTHDLSPRFWTWGSAVSGFLDRPILGWGAENFPYPFDKYYNPNHFGRESFFDRTHNVFLEYAITGGVILLIAWLAIFFWYYRALARSSLPRDLWWRILFILPIIYLIQGFFLFDVLVIFVSLFLFLAFFLITNDSPQTTELAPSAPLGHEWLLLAAAIAFAFIFQADYWLTNEIGAVAIIILIWLIHLAEPAERNLTAPYPEYALTGKSLIFGLSGTVLIILLLILTAILPLQKNLLLANTLKAIPDSSQYYRHDPAKQPGLTQEEFRAYYQDMLNRYSEIMRRQIAAYEFYSPVGQEETIGALFKFSNQFIDGAGQSGFQLPTEALRKLVDLNNEWFDSHIAIMPGLKNAYLNGGLNLRAGIAFKQGDYLARGKKMFSEALALAPSRIEFIRIMIEVARAERDSVALTQLIKEAKFFRPDLPWDQLGQ